MRQLLLISGELGAVPEFIGKPGARVVFVPTAADLDQDRWYVEKDRQFLQKRGFDLVDLKVNSKLTSQAMTQLKTADALYVAGGNSFYLLKMFQESGLSKVIFNLVNKGLLYIGASAGAAVAGPSLDPLQKLDNPSVVSLSSLEGLRLTNFVPLPHYVKGNLVYQEILNEFRQTYKLIPFTDNQAIKVSGSEWKVISSVQGA